MTESLVKVLELGGPALFVVFLWFLERQRTSKLFFNMMHQSTKALTELNKSIVELTTLLREHCRRVNGQVGLGDPHDRSASDGKGARR